MPFCVGFIKDFMRYKNAMVTTAVKNIVSVGVVNNSRTGIINKYNSGMPDLIGVL